MFSLALLLYFSYFAVQGRRKKRAKMKKSSSSKELLINWLRTALDCQMYPGLGWSDREEEIFFVKWVHKSSEQWSGDDLAPFKAWAAHKGKLDGKNPKQLKATFRCALNSKKELLEHHRSRERRYWQFVDPNTVDTDKAPKKRRKNNKTTRSRIENPLTVSSNKYTTNIEQQSSLRISSRSDDEMSRTAKLPAFDSFSNFEPLTPPDQTTDNIFNYPDLKFPKEKIYKMEKCEEDFTDHVTANFSSMNINNLLQNSAEEYRPNYTPPPEQSCLTPPQKTYSNSLDSCNQSVTDVWQPNCWPAHVSDKETKGLSDFFSSDFIGLYKSSTQEPESNTTMDFLDMDQYVPVTNTSITLQVHNKNGQSTLLNKTPLNNPMQTDHMLEKLDDFFLGDDVDPEACRKLMQEIDRTSSVPQYRFHS